MCPSPCLGQLQALHVQVGRTQMALPVLFPCSGPGREPRPAQPRGDDPSQLRSTLRNQTHVLM